MFGGGVNMREKQIYIKNKLIFLKMTLSWGVGVCRMSTGGLYFLPSGGVKISLSSSFFYVNKLLENCLESALS